MAWSVLRVGIPLAAATFLAGEYVAPPAERIAQTVRASGDEARVVAQQFESGFWFKQDLTFVNIRTVLADMTLSGVRMYEFGDDLRLKVVRVAQIGNLRRQRPVEARKRAVDARSAPMRRTSRRRPYSCGRRCCARRSSTSTRWRRSGSSSARCTTTSACSATTRRRRRASRSRSGTRSSTRLAVLVMMVLALPFAHFQRRQGGVGFRIFAGTMIGLSFFLLGRLFSNLGVLNDWPPLFSAVFPLAVSSLRSRSACCGGSSGGRVAEYQGLLRSWVSRLRAASLDAAYFSVTDCISFSMPRSTEFLSHGAPA